MKIPLKITKNKCRIRAIRYLLCFLFVLPAIQPVSAQTTQSVSGKVVDGKTGEPLIGVSVMNVGSKNGTITDMNGYFFLNAQPNSVLQISYTGYITQNVTIRNSTELTITLNEDSKLLDEVVVTAFGITRDKKSLTTAIGGVDLESMTESRSTNLTDMLSGKVAGLQVTPGSGPLSSTRLVLRGVGSLTGNNQPLVVIDGVPVVNESGEAGDLDFGNIVNSMNPDEIENIEVLKGANAAALYGSDAANGVLLITTKKAVKKEGLGVSYGLNMMFGYLYNFPTYQNIYGAGQNNRFQKGYNYYGATANGITYNPELPYGIHVHNLDGNTRSWGMPMLGFDVVGRDDVVRPYSPAKSTIEDMYQTSKMITNSLSLDKVYDRASLRFSYTNVHSDDILENFNKLNRHIFNNRTTAKLAPFLDLDLGIRYTYEKVDNRGFRNNSARNPLHVITGLSRDATIEELTPWKKPDGTAYTRTPTTNPYWLLNETGNADQNHWFTGNITLDFKLHKLFKFRLKGATDVNSSKGWNFTNYYSPFDLDGYYERRSNLNTNNNFDALFSYDQRLKNDITVSANVGAWMQNIRRDGHISKVDVLAEPDKKSLSNNAGTMFSSETYNGKDKQAIFGTANAGYKDWLYFDVTARNEWSSTLPAKNNSYFYYSVGSAFILTDLIKIDKKILSFAKLRASYAKVGNDTGFDNLYNSFSYAGTYLSSSYFVGDNIRKNPNLKPEESNSWEFGTDLRFFNNRLSIDFTYYDKRTKDQIVRADMSPVSGYTSQWINAGEIRNRGTEISITATPIKIRNFSWTTNVNWAKNNSMVIRLAEGIDRFLLGTGTYIGLYAQEGEPYGVFYGNDYRRDEMGRIYVDQTGIPLYNEDQYLGSTQPKWLGGWRNSFKVGPVDLSVMIDFQKGGKIWSNTAYQGGVDGTTVQSLEGRYEYLFSDLILGETNEERQGLMNPGNTVRPGADYYGNHVIYIDDRSKGVYIDGIYGPDIDYWAGKPSIAWTPPTNYWTHNKQTSAARYIYDASYIKLREISAGYNLPKKWLKNTPLYTAKISVVGRNVAILHQNTPKGVDPQATRTSGNAQGFEMGFALPQATWGFDLKVSF